MKTRAERERELIDSGLVSAIKQQFAGKSHSISDEYMILIADYIDSMSQVENLNIDSISLARYLPNVLTKVQEFNLGGIHGRTDKDVITMNSTMDYETKKLFFFHELTHALQTRKVNGNEECGFYNGNTGMFLTEGATQFTAEILYNVSNGGDLKRRQQPNVVTGQPNHTSNSPLSQYQFNGNILYLLSVTTKTPLNQLLPLGFNPNGREILKQRYEQLNGNEGKFEEFMLDLEKIYSIEKLSWFGYYDKMADPTPTKITLTNGGATFDGNFQIQNELMIKTQRNLMADFILNNDVDYILANYQQILVGLTTNDLKINFMNTIEELRSMIIEPAMNQQIVGVHR